MELLFWRHAEAEDGKPDLGRRLTPKGRAQAERIAAWIREHVPPGFQLISSPAARAQETAQALQIPFATSPLLAPGAPVAAILSAAGWPDRAQIAIVVGHQPDLGRAAAFVLSGQEQDWHIDKGALWWLAGGKQVFIKAVASPDLLQDRKLPVR